MVKLYYLAAGGESRKDLDLSPILEKVKTALAMNGCVIKEPFVMDHFVALWTPYLLSFVRQVKIWKQTRLEELDLEEDADFVFDGIWRQAKDKQEFKEFTGRKIRKGLWIFVPYGELIFEFAQKLCSSIVTEADDYVRRMCELAEVFGLNLSKTECHRMTLLFTYLSFTGTLVKQFKYSVNLSFNQFWKVDPPVHKPHLLGEDLWPRSFRIKLKLLNLPSARIRYHSQVLMNTMFQGFKKGLLPGRPDMVCESLLNHKKALTKDPLLDESQHAFLDRMLDPLRGIRPPMFQRAQFPELSRKATVENSFSNEGTVGFAWDNYLEDQYDIGRHSHTLTYKARDVELYDDMIFFRRKYGRRTQLLPMVPEFKGFAYRRIKFPDGSSVKQDWCVKPVYSQFLTKKESYYWLPTGVEENPRVCPAFILEPMKVRTITKPDAGLYSKLSSYQKQGWKWLKDQSCGFFKLIGEPLQREHLWSLFGTGLRIRPNEFLVSGDYSAATDNLKGEFSERVTSWFFSSLQDCDPVSYQNIIRSMTHCEVLQSRSVLPDYKEFWPYVYPFEDFDQQNGQLMGNVISFIILCLCNYLSYHQSWERYFGCRLNWWNVPGVLINGDDILFKSNDDHYPHWAKVVESYGFSPSIGKNYCSRDFVQINSELFRIDINESIGMVSNLTKIPYINFGYLTGRAKQDCSVELSVRRHNLFEKQNGEDLSGLYGRAASLPQIESDLVVDLPNKLAERAQVIFWRHMSGLLDLLGVGYIKSYPKFRRNFMLKSLFGDRLNKWMRDQSDISQMGKTFIDKADLELRKESLHIKERNKNKLYYYFISGINCEETFEGQKDESLKIDRLFWVKKELLSRFPPQPVEEETWCLLE
jgi:hypothetical protein